MIDAESANRVETLRQKQLNGTLTLEEAREAIALLRAGRQAAASAPRRTSAKVTLDTDAMIDELDAL